MPTPPPRGVGVRMQAPRAGQVVHAASAARSAIQAEVSARRDDAAAMRQPASQRPTRRHQSPAALCRGLIVPQCLQLGHCQWCARALKPQRWQR